MTRELGAAGRRARAHRFSRARLRAPARTALGLGGGVDDANTIIADNRATETAVLMSGKTTTTVKQSIASPGTSQLWGAGLTGDDYLLAQRSAGQKMWLISGKMTSTVKSSAATPNIVPGGIESADINDRLGAAGGGGSVGMFGLIFDNDFV